MSLERITTNISGKARLDKMGGREYLVVPMVMLTEGVHAGSGGPLYYPAEELKKTPVVWNHKPIVVYHPTINGEGVSACDPEILTKHQVGLVMNTKYKAGTKKSPGKLPAEAWIDTVRANEVDPRVMESIENDKMMELSTGLFTDNEDVVGEWNGEPYDGIARNYRPDHLALLPDQVGACSIKDGAGFLRLNSEQDPNLKARLNAAVAGIMLNERSFEDIRSDLYTQLRAYLTPKFPKNTNYVDFWIENVYKKFLVYSYNNKLWKLEYTATKTVTTLSTSDPVEVKRVTEYRTIDGAFVGNAEELFTKEPVMDKKAKIDALVANKDSGWLEADRAALEAMPDATLDKVVANAKPAVVPAPAPVATPAPVVVAPVANALTAAVVASAAPVDNSGTVTAPPSPVTLEQYISNAPPAMRDVLISGINAHNAQRAKLVGIITANAANIFKPEQLAEKTLAELEGIAALAAPPPKAALQQFNYAGAGGAPAVTNAGPEEEPYVMPTINFGEKTAA